MDSLQKFVEGRSNGKKSGRIAYALGPDNLPKPTSGFEWQAVPFDAGDELLRSAGLKAVFQAALETGCATVKIGG
jgi:hypothetical protein